MSVRVRFRSWIYRGGEHLLLTGQVSKITRMGTKYPRWTVRLEEVRGPKGHRFKHGMSVWIDDVLALV